MKHRKLRIAWSVVWGTGAVLLVALWVRSYFRSESYHRILSTNRLYGWGIESGIRNFPGNIEYRSAKFTSGSILSTGWQYGYYSQPVSEMKTDHPIDFKWIWDKDYKTIRFPHWSAAMLLSGIALLPWTLPCRWRFSLRTLLIATTLVAVGLGLIVWAMG